MQPAHTVTARAQSYEPLRWAIDLLRQKHQESKLLSYTAGHQLPLPSYEWSDAHRKPLNEGGSSPETSQLSCWLYGLEKPSDLLSLSLSLIIGGGGMGRGSIRLSTELRRACTSHRLCSRNQQHSQSHQLGPLTWEIQHLTRSGFSKGREGSSKQTAFLQVWLKLEKYCGPGSSGLILSLIKSLRSGLPLKHSDFSFLPLLRPELMDTLDKHCATEIHPAAKPLPL